MSTIDLDPTTEAGGTAAEAGPAHDGDVLVVEGVRKTFEAENAPVRALRGANLRVPAGDFVALMGPSGCGKSTLLNLVAGLDVADEGTIRVGGEMVTGRTEDELLAHPTEAHRHRLPVLQFAGEHDGAGERGSAGHHRRYQAEAGGESGPGPPRPPRGGGQGQGRARVALRWSAPAPGHRPGPGQPAHLAAGRRAHRRPRLGQRSRDRGVAVPASPRRADHRAGHPRQRRGPGRRAPDHMRDGQMVEGPDRKPAGASLDEVR